MTTEVAWLLIIANAIIAAVTIGNTWMLAWYGKRPRKKRNKQNPEEKKDEPRSRNLERAAPYGLIIVLSIVTIVYSLLKPNPDANLQILQIALSVGLVVLALVFSLISPLIVIVGDLWDTLIEHMELNTRFLESMQKKRPNTTDHTDTREDGG